MKLVIQIRDGVKPTTGFKSATTRLRVATRRLRTAGLDYTTFVRPFGNKSIYLSKNIIKINKKPKNNALAHLFKCFERIGSIKLKFFPKHFDFVNFDTFAIRHI